MKIDLDDLERKVREASESDDPDWGQGSAQVPSPGVTLALIARIRELEDELTGWRDSAANDRSIREDPARLTAILEKGAVLP